MDKFVVRIYKNETYHLHKVEGLFGEEVSSNAVPFYNIVSEPLDLAIPLQKKYNGVWEDVGEITLREILWLPEPDNSLFHSLRSKRGASYTWKEFVKARTKKIGEHTDENRCTDQCDAGRL